MGEDGEDWEDAGAGNGTPCPLPACRPVLSLPCIGSNLMAKMGYF